MWIHADPDPASQKYVDPDPASQNDVDPDPASQNDVDPDPASQNDVDLKPDSQNDVDPDPASQNDGFSFLKRCGSMRIRIQLPKTKRIRIQLPETMWIMIQLPKTMWIHADPDSASQNNVSSFLKRCGSGMATLEESLPARRQARRQLLVQAATLRDTGTIYLIKNLSHHHCDTYNIVIAVLGIKVKWIWARFQILSQ
jgi:hypothetical protein